MYIYMIFIYIYIYEIYTYIDLSQPEPKLPKTDLNINQPLQPTSTDHMFSWYRFLF